MLTRQVAALSFLLSSIAVTVTKSEGSSHLRRQSSVNLDPRTIALKHREKKPAMKRKFVSYQSSRWEKIW